MSRKLLNTNPYLRDPVQRERSVVKSVASSSAIEGIHVVFRDSATGRLVARSEKTASRRNKR